jgi:hypothetical protein
VIGQIMPFNPALSVRSPSFSLEEGKAPVLTREQARRLPDSIPI